MRELTERILEVQKEICLKVLESTFNTPICIEDVCEDVQRLCQLQILQRDSSSYGDFKVNDDI